MPFQGEFLVGLSNILLVSRGFYFQNAVVIHD
jgi:hypothetical protein